MGVGVGDGMGERSWARGAIWYSVGFVAVQVGGLALALVLAATPWFMSHDGNPGLRTIGYGQRQEHADCEVVLYGDSAALTGLDPEVVKEATGLTACNVSEAGWVEDVVGSHLPLDAYLAKNKRPRYLVILLTPSLFRPERSPFEVYRPDGMTYELQYNRGAALYGELVRRPDWVMNYALWAGHAVISDWASRHFPGQEQVSQVDPKEQREQRGGIFPLPRPVETTCVRTALHLDPSIVVKDGASVEAMRRAYGVEGTKVLIDIAPVPVCDELQQVYRERLAGLHDNAFETVPIGYFNEGDVHFSAAGSRYVSMMAAEQILAMEKQAAAAPVR